MAAHLDSRSAVNPLPHADGRSSASAAATLDTIGGAAGSAAPDDGTPAPPTKAM